MATQTDRKQIVCAIIIHLAATIGFFLLGLCFGNTSTRTSSNKTATATPCPAATIPEEPEWVIQSPYNLLSNKMMSELLIKVPIDAEQLSGILIYEGNRVIGRVLSSNICNLRARLINCSSPDCYFDVNDLQFLTAKETEEFSRILHGMIKCSDN